MSSCGHNVHTLLVGNPSQNIDVLGNATKSSVGGVVVAPSLGPSVRLSIRRPNGEYLKFDVGESTLIAELKAMISVQIGMPG